MIKGVIFDLDGVLVSTDELHFQAWQKLAQFLGINNFTREDGVRQRGVSRMASLEVVLEKANRKFTNDEKLGLAEQKNSWYCEMLKSMSGDDLLPGALFTLQTLKKQGILLGLGSASKNAPIILNQTGIADLFDGIADGSDVTKSKPDPEVFLCAAGKLGLSPKECLVVEDAPAGIQAASAGEMKSLGVGPLYRELGATYCAKNLAEPIDWSAILQ